MTFNEYQMYSRETAIYPEVGKNIIYPTLGLCGESGEIAEKVKKCIRDGVVLDVSAMEKELGDVLWYLAQLASECNLSLGGIAETNIRKLRSRKERGVLKGSGDER